MIEYKVTVDEHGTIRWYNMAGQLHCEHGPAIILTVVTQYYYINGNNLTKEEFESQRNSCDGKIVEVNGKKYRLTVC